VQIHCKYDELVNPSKLKNHPKNRNKHGQDQIEEIVEGFNYYGIRHPIIVSKKSGFIVVGHGRKLAAIRSGIKEYPVVYQDFETTEQEQGWLTYDNAISDWAELDLAGINLDIGDLGPEFNIRHLGIKDFQIDVSEKEVKNTGSELDLESFDNFQHQCPKCGFEWDESKNE